MPRFLRNVLFVIVCLLSLFSSETHAMFTGFPTAAGRKEKTARVIVKFKDWIKPDAERIRVVNEQIGVVSMMPLFTTASVGTSALASLSPDQDQVQWSVARADGKIKTDQWFLSSLQTHAAYGGGGGGSSPTLPPPSCGQPCVNNACQGPSQCDNATGMCKIPECFGQTCMCSLPSIPPPISGTDPYTSPELQNMYVLTISSTSPFTFNDIAALYLTVPGVESVEPDRRLHSLDLPNDPYYPQLWNMEKLGIPKVLEENNETFSVTVGLVDSGIDRTHEDLSGLSYGAGRDYATCEAFGANDECRKEKQCPKKGKGYCSDTLTDDSGHGTHVAGIIAAVTGNSKGIGGIAKKIKIVPVKVLNKNGDTFESWTYEGIVYAIHQGARVINISIGGCAGLSNADGVCPHTTNKPSTALRKVIDYALKRNVLVVVAAGNENDDAQWYTPPNYNTLKGTPGKVVVVGATGPHDERGFYSNYGSLVDLAAPGGSIKEVRENDKNGNGIIDTEDCDPGSCILSTYPPSIAHSRFSDSGYESHMGTSMAAPHVTGLLALLLSITPHATPDQMITIIQDSADPISTDKPIGDKRINAAAAIVVQQATELYVSPTCDKCGWCNPKVNPKPGGWEACSACLYDAETGLEKEWTYHTMFGCFSVASNTFPQEAIETSLSLVLGASGGVAFLIFLSGAALFMRSKGSTVKRLVAKDRMISSLLGLTIIIFAALILQVLGFGILQIPGFGI